MTHPALSLPKSAAPAPHTASPWSSSLSCQKDYNLYPTHTPMSPSCPSPQLPGTSLGVFWHYFSEVPSASLPQSSLAVLTQKHFLESITPKLGILQRQVGWSCLPFTISIQLFLHLYIHGCCIESITFLPQAKSSIGFSILPSLFTGLPTFIWSSSQHAHVHTYVQKQALHYHMHGIHQVL